MAGMIYVAILVWLVCPVLCYGMEFAYWQRKYPHFSKEERRWDMWCAITSAPIALATGPVMLVVAYLTFDRAKHGLKFF